MTEMEFVQRSTIVDSPTIIGIAFIVNGLAECLEAKRHIRSSDIKQEVGSLAVGFANYAQGLERVLNGAMKNANGPLTIGRRGTHGFIRKFDSLREDGSLDVTISKHYYAKARKPEDCEISDFIVSIENGFMSARYFGESDHLEIEPLDECMGIAVAAGLIEKFFPEELEFLLLRLEAKGLFV